MAFNLESAPPVSGEPSVLGILEDPTLSLTAKADYFELFLHTPVTKKRDYLRRWGLFTSKEVGGILTHTQARKVVEKFVAFHNLTSTNEGERAGHNTLTGFMFSDLFLPATMAIFEYGEQTNDIDALRQSSLALLILNDTLDILQTNDPRSLRESDKENLLYMEQTESAETILYPFDDHSAVGLADTLPNLHVQSMNGTNTDLQNLYCLMALSRLTAFQAIQANHNKPITIGPGIKIPKGLNFNDFASLASSAEKHFLEMKKGIDFPEDTLTRIKQSKALVVSLDWNSVWNMNESYANSHMIALTTETIKQLANDFHQRFPDKEIFFVMNTGRPAHYAWGVIEALSVIKELRIIGLAESGGVKINPNTGEITLNIKNKKEFKGILESLRIHLLYPLFKPGIGDQQIFEQKETMLSLRVSKQNQPEGPWLQLTRYGEEFSPTHIEKETKKFLLLELGSFREALNLLDLHNDKVSGLKMEGNISKQEAIRIAQSFFKNNSNNIQETKENLKKYIETFEYLQDNLVVDFNNSAGFVDIHLREVNKYSGLIKILRDEYSLLPKDIVVITVGDSRTDINPTTETSENENNDGADNVIGVAVGNSSPNLKEATEKRRLKNNRGIQTVTASILGLISMIKGLNRVIANP